VTKNINRTAKCWNDYTARFSGKPGGLFWWDVPEINEHINKKISDHDETDWVEYTINKYFANRLPLEKCLSLGCGGGHLERRLAGLNAFHQCDAYDVAEGSLDIARKNALDQGFINITYYAADIDEINLPNAIYDCVWVNGAMHHFSALEHVCNQILNSLKPDGLLILNEYIGPNRFQFSIRQKEIANACLQLLPLRYRLVLPEQTEMTLARNPVNRGLGWFISRIINKVQDRDLIGAIHRRIEAYTKTASHENIYKETIVFPSINDVISADPSEAVRSEEIIGVLNSGFDIIEKKYWGGNIYQFLLAGIAGNFCNADRQTIGLIKMILNIEEMLIDCGELDSDFAYIVACPKIVSN
jgi:SAM-dependent methyltransferase